MELPSQDSATGRSLKAGSYAAISAVSVFFLGLVTVVNTIPGCSEAVFNYVYSHVYELILAIGLAVGVPAGAMSFLVNFTRKGVKNY
jgi:hypothetical protein